MRTKDDGCREAFVKMIKQENEMMEGWCKQSIAQNWAGKKYGFKDHMVQKRWDDFQKGWDAKSSGAQHGNSTENK